MGLAAYIDLSRPKFMVPQVTEIMHCEECGKGQDTLCRWEKAPAKWVCPDCFGDLREASRGQK